MNLTPHEQRQQHTGKEAQSNIRQQIISWFNNHAWAASISIVITGFVLYVGQYYSTEAYLRATVEKQKAFREEEIYKKLIEGSSFNSIKEPLLPQTSFPELILNLVELSANANEPLYPLIIGQHGVSTTEPRS